MKKYFLLTVFSALLSLTAFAQESISVGDVFVAKGNRAMMEVKFHFNANHDWVSYQFNVNLPEGISLVAAGSGKVSVVLGDGQVTDDDVTWSSDLIANASPIMKGYSNPSTPIAANDGVLVCIPITADESLVAGTELQGTLSDFVLVTSDSKGHNDIIGTVEFTIKVTEKVVLDENYTWEPFETDDDVDIEVKRTIKANEWSTICLPFDMDGDQVHAAFGDDVLLMELPTGKNDTPFDFEADGNNVTSITINFVNVEVEEDGFAANTPYLIKTAKDITEFTATATIAPDDPTVGWSKGSGTKKKTIDFIGTYKAGTTVPDGSLFLSGKQFWYSAGKTKMKAFRGYFTLNKELANKDLAGARILLNIGGETTDIERVNWSGDDDRIYDLQGRPVQNPSKKGLYIRNGKKEVVK